MISPQAVQRTVQRTVQSTSRKGPAHPLRRMLAAAPPAGGRSGGCPPPSGGISSSRSRLLVSARFNSTLPPSGEGKPPPSRHILFYRDILPPLARVLAYGSGVYFAAHLAWTYLDGQEQAKLEAQERTELEKAVRKKREDVKETVQEKVQEGKSWLGGWFGKKA